MSNIRLQSEVAFKRAFTMRHAFQTKAEVKQANELRQKYQGTAQVIISDNAKHL